MARIAFVDRDYPHHGHFSGYKQLARYIRGDNLSSGSWFAKIPERLFYKIPYTHPLWYNRQTFALELNVSGSLLLHSGFVFHYLYGEASFRLGGYANRLWGRRNRIVATYHQLPQFFEQRRKLLAHLNDLDAIILVASNQRGFFDTIVDSRRVHVIQHGVDTDFFQPDLRADRAKRTLRCLTVGSNYRNFDLHVQVIDNIHRSLRDIEFMIVGEPYYAEHFGGLENVRYLSGISDAELLKCYQSADILLLPLADATACNGLLEGMACGLPIVVTEVGGVRDYVDETCAMLTPATDASVMTEQILALLRDESKRCELGRQARCRAVAHFDWKQIANRMQVIYEQVW
jgi:glycosyltransferase involved in cell wall biosynthesis